MSVVKPFDQAAIQQFGAAIVPGIPLAGDRTVNEVGDVGDRLQRDLRAVESAAAGRGAQLLGAASLLLRLRLVLGAGRSFNLLAPCSLAMSCGPHPRIWSPSAHKDDPRSAPPIRSIQHSRPSPHAPAAEWQALAFKARRCQLRMTGASRFAMAQAAQRTQTPRRSFPHEYREAVVGLRDHICVAVDLVEENLVENPDEHIHCALIAPHGIAMVMMPVEDREADADQRRSRVATNLHRADRGNRPAQAASAYAGESFPA